MRALTAAIAAVLLAGTAGANDDEFINTDPTAPWNDYLEKDNPDALHNDYLKRDDPDAPWNHLNPTESEVDDYYYEEDSD